MTVKVRFDNPIIGLITLALYDLNLSYFVRPLWGDRSNGLD